MKMDVNSSSEGMDRRSDKYVQTFPPLSLIDAPLNNGGCKMEICHDYIRCGSTFQYEVRIPTSLTDKLRAWNLTYKVYRKIGYARQSNTSLWVGAYDIQPSTIQILAERNGKPCATLSLVFDSAAQLPADELYSNQINSLRKRGCVLCEVISLSSDEAGVQGLELMKYLIKFSYIAARHLRSATDLLITVTPRHAEFYKSCLLFSELGPKQVFPKINNTVGVLLHMDLLAAWDMYQAAFDGLEGSRNLYRFFVHAIPDIRQWLQSQISKSNVASTNPVLHGLLNVPNGGLNIHSQEGVQ